MQKQCSLLPLSFHNSPRRAEGSGDNARALVTRALTLSFTFFSPQVPAGAAAPPAATARGSGSLTPARDSAPTAAAAAGAAAVLQTALEGSPTLAGALADALPVCAATATTTTVLVCSSWFNSVTFEPGSIQ